MSHYSIDQWVEYGRDLLGIQDRATMLTHLDTGCPECARLSEFTDKVVRTCASAAAVQVPESVLKLARAIYPVRAKEQPRRGSRIPIEMIFDSFLVPAPAGLRAIWQVGWQGLYRAGDCSLDLRIEPELRSSRAAVIGQITNHVAPEVHMSNLAVSLRSGKQVVAETVSNRFGEFQLEYEEQPQLKLCIHMADSRVIRVPLKKLAEGQTAASSSKPSRKRGGATR